MHIFKNEAEQKKFIRNGYKLDFHCGKCWVKRIRDDKKKECEEYIRRRYINKAEKVLFRKKGIHLAETVRLLKSYRNKKKRRRIILPARILDCPIHEHWFAFVAGYRAPDKDKNKKGKFVIGRYYNDSALPKHYILPSTRFIKKYRSKYEPTK